MMMFHHHPFHLVDPSPWPLTSSIGAFLLTSGLVKWFHFYSIDLFLMGGLSIILSMVQWWRDVVREGTFQGLHTIKVRNGLQWGMVMFIISEALFFFSFFWAFFHSSLTPSPELGSIWPPIGVQPFNPFNIPLLNTAILLASGATVTWAHHSLSHSEHSEAVFSLFLTILLGIYFTALQAFEYMEAPFSIADAIYGSTFFVATGFHGLHVIIGTTFLFICFTRLVKAHFSSAHHFGFEAAAWYWHFVDVVWLFLYISIYWWGGSYSSMQVHLISIQKGSTYSFFLISGLVMLLFISVMMSVSPLLGMKQLSEYEKSSPFECGFDPVGMGRLNFSVRFFLIAVIFLIFDVEIALLLPLMIITPCSNYMIWGVLSAGFLLVLSLGTFYEWKEGALDWKI